MDVLPYQDIRQNIESIYSTNVVHLTSPIDVIYILKYIVKYFFRKDVLL